MLIGQIMTCRGVINSQDGLTLTDRQTDRQTRRASYSTINDVTALREAPTTVLTTVITLYSLSLSLTQRDAAYRYSCTALASVYDRPSRDCQN